MEYSEKLDIANAYLMDRCGLTWDDLPDINSLHDAETKDDVITLCNERLKEEGYPFDSFTD